MSSIDMCHSSKAQHSAFDFEGLEESLVDNNDDDDDDEDFPEPDMADQTTIVLAGGPDSSGIIFDQTLVLVRDALIRDSANRTEDDIEIIVRFLSAINSNHDHMTRKRLAPHFVLAEIESRDTRVLTHDEKLDAYCIVAAGSLRHVIPCGDEFFTDTLGSPVDDDCDHMQQQQQLQLGEHQHGGSGAPQQHSHHRVRYLHIGDEFGAHLNDRVVYGEIFTNENFVWVLCVPHVIFDQICGEKAFKTIKDEVTGHVIEMRTNCFLSLPEGSETVISAAAVAATTTTTAMPNHAELNNHAAAAVTHHMQPPNSISSANYLSSCDDYSSAAPMKITVSGSATTASSGAAATTTAGSVVPPKSLSLSPSNVKTPPNSDNNELIRATKERLFDLVLNSDPSEVFIEDFLLTFRIWSEKDLSPLKDSVIMNDLMNRICANIRNGSHLENCVRIVLIWMVNHFQDFLSENRYLLEEFEGVLKEKSLKAQLRLFHMNLSAKSIERQVTVTRSDRNSSLPFQLIGGYECSARLFIGEIANSGSVGGVSQNTPPNQAALDLRPGDRVISINGVDCHVMPIGRAYELCRSSTHLSLKVKYDPHLFNALIEGRYENKRQMVETFPLTNRLTASALTTGNAIPNAVNAPGGRDGGGKGKENTTGQIWKQKMRSLVSMTTNQLINSTSNILNNGSSSNATANSVSGGNHSHTLNNSSSNPSLSSSSASSANVLSNVSAQLAAAQGPSTHTRILSYEIPEIIKIYLFENNDARFLPIHSSTTARECIQLALREFQLQSNYSSRDFALYEYSVIFNNANGMPDEASVASSTMVKRLSDGTSDLVHNLGLNSRFYLKLLIPSKDSNSGGGSHLTDNDIAKEIVKDYSSNSLLTLNANAIARELTARDFRLFCKIEAQQFVYDLAYNDPNGSTTTNNNHDSSSVIFERTRELQDFERRTNEEMFWAISQVLEEKRSLTKRVKVIKQLIRVANVAMKLNNFNTLFAILSGLSHSSVDRLRNCWDKVPNKDMKKLQKLKQIMDPSRNFYNFRQKLLEILRQDNGAFIIIPFFPLVKKDLSFIWLANQTYVNSKEPQTPSSISSSESSKSLPTSKDEMLVNWEKMRLLSEKIREIQKMTNTTSLALAAVSGLANANSSGGAITSPSVANEPIDPNLLFRIFADATTSEDPRTFSHKRLWENQRMMKRVQSFLDETYGSVTSDEQELLSRSHSCELPQTPNSSHATTRSSIASTMSSNSQLSHPSPTPSSASSSSNSLSMHSDGTPGVGQLLHRPARPRFGQTSPNQLRKLLALSDGSVIVPHNNHHQSQHQPAHNQQASGSNSGNGSGGGGGGSGIAPATSSAGNHFGAHHVHHHHLHQQYSNHHRSSNSSLNSSLSSNSAGYYNSIYGCHPSASHNNHSYQSSTMMSGSNSTNHSGGGYGNGTLNNNSSSGSYYGGNNHHHHNHNHNHHHNHQHNHQTNHHHNHHHQKMPYNHHSHGHTQPPNSGFPPDVIGNSCCGAIGPSQIAPCCGGGPQSGALYPNQSYCSCCNPNTPLLRSSLMMMPPPQTSGLMHPACPCTPSHQSSRRQQNTLPAKQSLPVESSSVTSFRRLEQYQQMTRYREIRTTTTTTTKSTSTSRRPQCPDYDTTMQRISSGGTSITVNGNVPPPSNSGLMGKNSIPPPPSASSSTGNSHHHRSNAQHHREDIV